MLSLFLSSSIILDLFDIRAHEGNYVLFIVWVNLISGTLFLTSAAGFVRKSWAASPLIVSAAVLAVAFVGLLFHISSGAAYEARTIGAMIFRMSGNVVLAQVVHSVTKKQKSSVLTHTGVLLLLPLSLLTVSCKHASEKNQ